MNAEYAELHCLSNFSFQRGASSAAELFERAARLGYRALAITDECTLAGIVRAWQADFPDAPPVGHLVRHAHADRWLRIHSLPDSKRYPDTDADMGEILRRHTAVATDVLGNDACALVTGAYASASDGDWSVPMHEADEAPFWLNLTVRSVSWRPGAHDALLRAVAHGDAGPVLFYAPALGQAYAPYDGGADLFFRKASTQQAHARRYAAWRSPLPSGL